MPSPQKLDKAQYIPLHVHSEYSLLDGASRIEDICKKLKENNVPGCALTEHGTMFSAYKFYIEAKANSLKPIIGCEIYVINQDHKLKGREYKSKLYHLVLLAKNDQGYKNLIKIVSESCIHGFYYKPRISKDFLKLYSGDLIALSACLGGEVNNLLLNGLDEKAKEKALQYKEIFGDDFYLEIMDHKYHEDRLVNPKIIELGKALGIKVVATNDSHFTNADEAVSHDALLCLQTGTTIADYDRMKFSSYEYLRLENEMLTVFENYLSKEDIQKSVLDVPTEIYNKIEDYELFKNPPIHLPDPQIPEGYTFETYLSKLTYDAVSERYGTLSSELKSRIDLELQVMNESGFASYFLVVWDFIKWAREHNIAVGPGRGSVAGSVVAYCLGITNIDPLKYDLLFERFLNPERKSMPDIDTDFCIKRREEVIDYVKNKYGNSSVCQIITFNRLTSKAVIKDMARVLEYPYAKAEELAKLIPVVRGKPRSIDWMLENHDEFKDKYKNDPEAKEVINLALKNEGLTKTFGVHAAGVIIADMSVDNIIPISKSNDSNIITQFAMDECASLGLLKMDFLGLRNLTMIQTALQLIKANPTALSTSIDIDRIPLDDPATYKTIASGNLAGIFQLETSAGMKQIAKELDPENMEDISALIALYRPGPLDTGMIDDFINRKNGKKEIVYDHPLLEPILKNTYGTIVYQEQIMQIAQKLAGFSLGEADLLRRAMGKKKPEVLLPYRNQFIEGCKNNSENISEELAQKLFDQMISFAEYCFNKSHSTAYGFITYQTAYLKTHYPLEYMCSLFISADGDIDRIKTYIVEAKRLNIEIIPPHVNLSKQDFAIVYDVSEISRYTKKIAKSYIVFGLRAIKGLGDNVCESVITKRNQEGLFKDFYDLCLRCDSKILNKKTLEALVKSGALDNLGLSRKAMINNADAFVTRIKKQQEKSSIGQASLFAAETMLAIPQCKDEGEFEERELQAMEYELLGLFVSNHPMQSLEPLTRLLNCQSIKDLESKNDKAEISVAALITDFTKKLTKSNKQICILALEDMENKIEGVMFSKTLVAYEHLVQKGKRVLLKGNLAKHSEGDMSIMVDKIEDLDQLSMIEFRLDLEKIKDYYQFFDSLRNLLNLDINKGKLIPVFELSCGLEKRSFALHQRYCINDLDSTIKRINDFIQNFSELDQKELQLNK